MADFPIVWPSVTPVPFTACEGTYWRDGKPWCSVHHRCVVPARATGSVSSSHYPTDGGTHLCPNCMREHLDSITHHQEATP